MTDVAVGDFGTAAFANAQPPAAAAGQETITPSALNTVTDVTVTFPAGRFSMIPNVTLGLVAHASLANYRIGHGVPTTTGFTLSLVQTAGTVAATSIDWIAMEST